MRVLKTELENVANIKSLQFDLASHGPGLIALIGENGSGKTHLMEACLPTPLFREWPSSAKSGAKSAKAGEGFIEHCWLGKASLKTTIEFNGDTYLAELRANPSINKAEAYLQRNGEELNKDGKLPEYSRLIASIFPSKDIILSAPFATQTNQGSFFRLDTAARMTLFCRLLGIEDYEIIAKESADLAKDIGLAVEELLSQIDDTKQRLGEVEKQLDIARAARLSVQGLRRTMYLVAQEGFESGLVASVYSEVARGLSERKLWWGEAPKMPSVEITEIDQGAREANRAALWEQWEKRIKLESYIRDLKETIDFKQNLIDQSTWALDRFQKALTEADRTVGNRLTYITSEVSSLTIASTAAEKVDMTLAICRRCPLTKNAKYSSYAVGLLNEVSDLETRIRDYTKTKLVVRMLGEQAAHHNLHGSCNSVRTTLSREMNNYIACKERIEQYNSFEAKAEAADRALEHVREQISLVEQATREREEKKLNWIEEIFLAWYNHHVDNYKRLLAEYERCTKESSTHAGTLTDLEPAQGEYDSLCAKLSHLEQEVEAQRIVAQDHTALHDTLLSMRRATIEASKQEVEEIANELLSKYKDGEFRIFLDTTSKTRGSTKEKEDFLPRIYDVRHGIFKTSGSGGQQAIFDEALKLAICMVNANRSGVHFDTLFRDETTSALTRDFAGDYIKMLRKAMEIGHFYQIVFVSHHENIWSQADVQVHMDDGELV